MKNILLIFFFIGWISASAQYSRHIIELTDKKGTIYNLNNPSTFLSAAAIDRKKTFNIPIDSSDLPVTSKYIDSISSFSGVRIINTSKWLNLVVIETTNSISLEKIKNLGFVKKEYPIANRLFKPENQTLSTKVVQENKLQSKEINYENSILYGKSSEQISIHNGAFLHDKGFQGNGVKIAVFDAGFYNYLKYPAFDSIRSSGRIKYTWDLVNNEASVNEDDAHGMSCLSIMGANLPGIFVGSSPKADYYLFRTEDPRSEFPIEEFNWLIAAEKADSIGVQIISSSLGYTTFDDPYFNHQYNDLNGKGTIVSRAASIAVAKGIIVANSAGNEGDDPWKYISAPADGINVLAVGAINTSNQIAPFSGFGPSADGRIKPDVVSVGLNTQLISTNGNVGIGNGTSFSNPNLAGLIACLWQAFPEFSNLEILQAVKQSSSQYLTPDNRKGYGIPNMVVAYLDLINQRDVRNAKKILTEKNIKLFPNPFINAIKVAYKAKENGLFNWILLNAIGQKIQSGSLLVKKDEYYVFNINELEILPKGKYYFTYHNSSDKGFVQVIK
ncbi:MAG: S8 family peptidase [Chitinophagaceae bacterium]